jgi:hypothetical protein
VNSRPPAEKHAAKLSQSFDSLVKGNKSRNSSVRLESLTYERDCCNPAKQLPPVLRRHLEQIVRQLAVRVRWLQCPPTMVRLITPTNASTPLLTEVLNIVQRAA